jgi:hypothetical protein
MHNEWMAITDERPWEEKNAKHKKEYAEQMRDDSIQENKNCIQQLILICTMLCIPNPKYISKVLKDISITEEI